MVRILAEIALSRGALKSMNQYTDKPQLRVEGINAMRLCVLAALNVILLCWPANAEKDDFRHLARPVLQKVQQEAVECSVYYFLVNHQFKREAQSLSGAQKTRVLKLAADSDKAGQKVLREAFSAGHHLGLGEAAIEKQVKRAINVMKKAFAKDSWGVIDEYYKPCHAAQAGFKSRIPYWAEKVLRKN